jgi:hypothetical protein
MTALALLVVFLLAALVYARATKDMQRLDKIRLEREPPPPPEALLGAATDFMRKMGLPMAPGGRELEQFCARNGLQSDYDRANRKLLGAIAVAGLCIAAIVWLGPMPRPTPPA